MIDDYDQNTSLFENDDEEIDPNKDRIKYIFGLNPNRTSAIQDLFSNEMMETINQDESVPSDAKYQLIFKMAVNSVLDMVMECLEPDMAQDVASYLDNYIGTCIVNKKFGIDLFRELKNAILSVKQNDWESDQDFDRRLKDLEESWWSIPQPMLNKRNPNDAIHEEMMRYGLNC